MNDLADRYRIEREIGQGGMATVYLAQDLKHQRRVALKVLKPELAAAIGADRFLREITTTANLRHPHILHRREGLLHLRSGRPRATSGSRIWSDHDGSPGARRPRSGGQMT